MGYGDSNGSRKFYGRQVTRIIELLEKYTSQPTDLDKYLAICAQLEQEPDPDKMPLTASDFPEEVQVAFFMYDLLSDKWDGTSGSYMGKDWVDCEFLFKLYEVEDQQTILYFMKMYERVVINFRAQEAETQRKTEERKAKAASGGGQQYTHNVKG